MQSTSAANKEVEKADVQHRKKRGTYHHCDDGIRAIIAKYSCENGNKAAAVKFSSKLGHDVSENSEKYEENLPVPVDNIKSLPHGRGRPLMLGSCI